MAVAMTFYDAFEFFKESDGIWGVFFDMILCFPEGPGGGIGRRTSFRY